MRVMGAMLITAVFAACGGSGGTDEPGGPGDDDPNNPTQPDQPDPSANPESPGARGYNAVAYTLVGAFDWTRQKLTAHETITLDLAPGHSTIELDTKVDVTAIKANTGATLAFTQDRAAGHLTVELGTLGAAGGRIALGVDYSVGTSSALLVGIGRDDDPVTSRLVFTDSEPDRAREWLVANDHPSDRAVWTVELAIPAGHDMVANGVRVSDKMVNGARVIRYKLDQRIPTYMMAFAAGELDHVDRTTASVPLSLWYRRGYLVDTKAHLDLLADEMAILEGKLGKYPWPSYGVLLVPFPFANGGMENASITFNIETTGQGNINRQTNAHELGHQWFGDWVTMADYEHVWFKEGMATVLQSYADRDIRSKDALRLFGLDYTFSVNDAIVDHNLYGISRYTSGPYQRAAWLITQVRARIGEDMFWAKLREILAANALGTLTGERFLQGFAPALSAAEVAQLVATLELKSTPTIALSTDPSDSRTLNVSLSDPDHQLLVPLSLSVIDGAGNATKHDVNRGESKAVTVPADGYLAPDEAELSASWNSIYNVSRTVYFSTLVPLLAPFGSQAASTAVLARTPAQQELMLNFFGVPAMSPDGFPAFYRDLDSTFARRSASISACLHIDPQDAADPWRAQIPLMISSPGIEGFNTAFSPCPAPQSAIDELTALTTTVTATTLKRLQFLMSFDYPADVAIAQIGKVATTAPSLQLREQALRRLAGQLNQSFSYSAVSDLAPWRALFRDQLAGAKTSVRFNLVWNAIIVDPVDFDALPIAAAHLHIYDLNEDAKRRVVCQASVATVGNDAAWQAFRSALHRDALPASVLATADNPTACNPPPLRAARAVPTELTGKPL